MLVIHVRCVSFVATRLGGMERFMCALSAFSVFAQVVCVLNRGLFALRVFGLCMQQWSVWCTNPECAPVHIVLCGVWPACPVCTARVFLGAQSLCVLCL